ncbi:MAG: hypothetical protein IJQ14_03255, partial [Bacteroidales bacterium]|nr:hypothetical protein [Bacteroidales bacterium]
VQSLFSQSLNNDWTTTGQRPNNGTVGLLVSVVNQCIVETRNRELEIRGWYLRIFLFEMPIFLYFCISITK